MRAEGAGAFGAAGHVIQMTDTKAHRDAADLVARQQMPFAWLIPRLSHHAAFGVSGEAFTLSARSTNDTSLPLSLATS